MSVSPARLRRLLACLVALANGLWSGYPPCCVLWFVRLYARGVRFPAEHCWTRRGETDLWDGTTYVLCERCFRAGRRTRYERRGCLPEPEF